MRVHGREHLRGSRRHDRLGYDFIHAAVDDRSRVAYAEILPDERKETASAFMTRAVGFFADRGITVERVLTDNGAARPYESNDARTQELERWLHTYNYHRPHMAHAGRSPITVLNNVPRKHN